MSRSSKRFAVFLIAATIGTVGVVGLAAYVIIDTGAGGEEAAASRVARQRLYGPSGRAAPKRSPELSASNVPRLRPRGMQFSGPAIDDPEDRPPDDETPAPEPLAIDREGALSRFRDALGECEDWRQQDTLPDRKVSRGLYSRLANGFEAVSGFADAGAREDREFLELAYGEMMSCVRDLDLRRPRLRPGNVRGP